ncbi:hypothetical protein [Rhizobium rhizogenes]|jgi:hypothetical protein|uniref:hypothetical protein n=1 Tax=Rhizobium rhizogenes TaxID=359 RepID=UPI000647EC45|nr:hypothetical protein [Rhizobium rhizogenes]
MIRALVDELIPGAEGWPSASDAGVHGIIGLRIFAEWNDEQITALADMLGWQSGGLSSTDAATRVAAVKGFETTDPELFDKIYTAVTLAYYETPFVIEAIQNTGRPYSYRPHVTGYKMEPFDFNRDRPKHGRGHYLKTDEVAPVDTSALDLNTVKTVKWGVEKR